MTGIQVMNSMCCLGEVRIKVKEVGYHCTSKMYCKEIHSDSMDKRECIWVEITLGEGL